MEEPNEAVKGAFLATAAAWAPLLGTALPSEYLALLAQLDKDFAKEPVRRAQCVTACDIGAKLVAMPCSAGTLRAGR